jgi:hypothetical protein
MRELLFNRLGDGERQARLADARRARERKQAGVLVCEAGSGEFAVRVTSEQDRRRRR